jgi:hypothetical protein
MRSLKLTSAPLSRRTQEKPRPSLQNGWNQLHLLILSALSLEGDSPRSFFVSKTLALFLRVAISIQPTSLSQKGKNWEKKWGEGMESREDKCNDFIHLIKQTGRGRGRG